MKTTSTPRRCVITAVLPFSLHSERDTKIKIVLEKKLDFEAIIKQFIAECISCVLKCCSKKIHF